MTTDESLSNTRTLLVTMLATLDPAGLAEVQSALAAGDPGVDDREEVPFVELLEEMLAATADVEAFRDAASLILRRLGRL